VVAEKKYELEEKDKTYIQCGADPMIQAGKLALAFWWPVRPVVPPTPAPFKAIQNVPS
jgi:hypothetical protein